MFTPRGGQVEAPPRNRADGAKDSACLGFIPRGQSSAELVARPSPCGRVWGWGLLLWRRRVPHTDPPLPALRAALPTSGMVTPSAGRGSEVTSA